MGGRAAATLTPTVRHPSSAPTRSRRVPRPTFPALVCAATLASASGGARAQPPTTGAYHVVRRIAAGGEGGWDYLTVDTAAHRLYVSRATHVMVIDTDRDSVVGDVGDTPGVHGIAVAADLGRGYVSNGRDSSVTVFDLKTLATVARVRGTGRNPDAILYEPSTRRVFAFNGGSATATVIDAAADTVVSTLVLGGRPEFAQADGSGRVFVNLEDRSEVVAFDARTLAVLGRYPLAPCEGPTGLALDPAAMRLYVGCANRRMAVVDARTGRVVTTVPAGDDIDATAFDPATHLALASARDGTLTVVATDDGALAPATVATGPGGKTIALDARTHRVYVPVARYGPAPASTAARPHPRPAMVAGSFTVLVLDR
ncbi:hypothetical protein tb265_00830 [Gemmatimonadetes bacterium T265]|nr:hypothetical protein tb265_00830 [Gemmatimonadetes bacterium T265]